MSSGQLTAVLIVAIVMFASVVRAIFGVSRHSSRRLRHGRDEELPSRNDGETVRLREEVKMLKERLAVIERITVEKENSLSRQIEELRDR